MKYWKNTKTLDHLIPELLETVSSDNAEIAVIGSKPIDLESMPRLKAIFKCGVGTDSISVNIDALKDDLQLFIGVKNV